MHSKTLKQVFQEFKKSINTTPLSDFQLYQPKEDDETEAGPEDRLPPRPHRHSLCNLQLGQVAKLSLPSSHDLSPRIILSLYEVTLMALYGNQQSWPVW